MTAYGRSYRYVGPPGLMAAVRPGAGALPIGSAADFHTWISSCAPADLAEPFTFVIDLTGSLRLASRRSEHVACAGGERVLSAGEMGFGRAADAWKVGEVTNQSTGYCPEVTSWPAVAAALDRIGLRHPGGFTHQVVFRRCERCQEHNIVRENDFVCVFCGADLPAAWNVDPAP
ncbi:hypothetical protein [Streptomyces sp. NPDC053427]|uniref:hypothetical protein n=1 Tax=Streptomyces sp. NPDC053427 TaxID=3365701 RepID=UPI0037D5B648